MGSGLTICPDEDTDSEHEQEDEVIDLMIGMPETGKEEAGKLMGDDKIVYLTGEKEDASELIGSNNEIIDLTGDDDDMMRMIASARVVTQDPAGEDFEEGKLEMGEEMQGDSSEDAGVT
ncbi:hypothetical protein L208DRAFT_1379646, partial [Tricholoma matsutake]